MVITTSCLSSFQLLQSFKEQSLLVVAKGLTWLKVGKKGWWGPLSHIKVLNQCTYFLVYILFLLLMPLPRLPRAQPSWEFHRRIRLMDTVSSSVWHHCQATYSFWVFFFFFLLFVFHTFNAFVFWEEKFPFTLCFLMLRLFNKFIVV